MEKFLKIFLIMLITPHRYNNNYQDCAYALKCYTCNYNAGIDTDECLTDPAAVVGRPVTNCNKKFCTITRQETKNPKGMVKTLSRHCADKPLFHNDVIEDSEFKTYYRSCTTDLCNSGNGVSSSGSITDPNQGAGENMIVRGLNTSSQQFNSFVAMLLILLSSVLLKLF